MCNSRPSTLSNHLVDLVSNVQILNVFVNKEKIICYQIELRLKKVGGRIAHSHASLALQICFRKMLQYRVGGSSHTAALNTDSDSCPPELSEATPHENHL